MKHFNHLLSLLLLLGTLSVSAQQTVYDAISESTAHTTLKAAIDAAELATTLDDETKAYTVFAPTNDAFAALGDVVSDLLVDPTGDLADILLYHVLGDSVASTVLTNGMIVDALNTDNTLKITVKSAGGVAINQAMVTTADIRTSNGIVHVIDAVLLPNETVVDVALDNSNFSTLVTAVAAAELLPALTNPAGTYTVFAPTNDAFAALGDVVSDLLVDPTGDLADILLYHVLGDSVASTVLTNGMIVDALNTDNTLKITVKSAGGVAINQAMVTTADIRTSNGIVHVIDAVLLPNETVVDVALDNSNFSTLVTAVAAAELLPALTNPAGTYTVFAPTNDAFAALGDVVSDLLVDPTGDLADILLYHVLGDSVASTVLTNGMIVDALNTDNTLKITVKSAGGVAINQAMVTTADIRTSNGIVHVIDAVLLPNETVVDVALDNSNFSTLVTAVIAAELLPALTNPAGTYTVFAPTNDAFAELGSTVDDLLLDPTGDLANILLYHVLGTTVLAADLVDDSKVATLLVGDSVTVELTGGVFINNATVIDPNNETGNGVVHAINKVLLPGSITSVEDELIAGMDFYPNPTTNTINVTSDNKNLTYTITNTSGIIIKTGIIGTGNNSINIQAFKEGTYMMNLSSNNRTSSIKFVKN